MADQERAGETQADYATRRRAAKHALLDGIAIMASEGMNWEFFDSACQELGLSEQTQESLIDEVAEELHRRADRLLP